jgi:hypothetical protein
MRRAGHVVRMGRREVYTGFWWGNLRATITLGRPRRRWEDNIKMDIQEVGCVDMDYIGLHQDRDRMRAIVKAVMNRRVPKNVGNVFTR